jgi:hypothetical protein
LRGFSKLVIGFHMLAYTTVLSEELLTERKTEISVRG